MNTQGAPRYFSGRIGFQLFFLKDCNLATTKPPTLISQTNLTLLEVYLMAFVKKGLHENFSPTRTHRLRLVDGPMGRDSPPDARVRGTPASGSGTRALTRQTRYPEHRRGAVAPEDAFFRNSCCRSFQLSKLSEPMANDQPPLGRPTQCR